MLVAAVGVFMSTLDSSIIGVSLPTLSDHFGTDIATIEWVILSYLLAITTLLLAFGRLSDMVGRRYVFSGGILTFTLGSALCSLSGSAGQLIGFRVVQGIGAAMTMATGPALITAAFPREERGSALGMMGSVVSVGLMTGPPLGGFLIDWVGWRSIFSINIPVGILGTAYALRVLRSEGGATPGAEGPRRFDLKGAFFMFCAVTSLLLAITRGQERGWGSAEIVGLFALAAAFLAWFLAVERALERGAATGGGPPLVELSLFRSRPFSASNVSSFLSFLGMFAVTLLMPFYMERILGYTPRHVGLALTAVPLAMALVAPFSGWVADRTNSYVLSSVGMAVTCSSLFVLGRLGPGASFADVVLRLGATGVGLGLFHSPNNSIIMGSVPRSRLGVAGGMLGMMRNLGMVTGLAVAGAAFARGSQAAQAGGAAFEPAFLAGFRLAFMLSAAISAVAVLTSLVRGSRGRIHGG